MSKIHARRLLAGSIGLSFGLAAVGSAYGLDTISYSGGIYTQNFNTLPKVISETNPAVMYDIDPTLGGGPIPSLNGVSDDMLGTGTFELTNVSLVDPSQLLRGWQLYLANGDGGFNPGGGPNMRWKVNNGSVSGGTATSFGSNGSSERAFGTLGSSTVGSGIGAVFTNTSDITLTQATITFTMEQWREGDVGADTVTFAYDEGLASDNINTTLSNNFAALNLTSISPTPGINMNLDGNLPVNQAVRTATLVGLNWIPGTNLILRWTDTNSAGQDDGFGIDNFSFSAVGGGATVTWTGAANTNWNTTDINWLNTSSAPSAFAANNAVVFGNTGIGTVNVDPAGVTPSFTTVANDSGTYTFTGGSIGGPGTLIKSGAGTLIINNSNTFQGGINITGGVVQISSDAALGNSVGGVQLNGGELRLGANVTTARVTTVSAIGGTLNTNGFNLASSGFLSIDGPLVKQGTGDLVLSGVVSSTETFSLLGGNLFLNQLAGTQNFIAPNAPNQYVGNITITNPARLNFGGGEVSGGGEIRTLTPGSSVVGHNRTGQNNNTVINNNIRLNFNNVAGPFFTYLGASGANTLTINGNISGNADVNIQVDVDAFGPGTVTFAGNNSFTGDVYINNDFNGVFRINSATAYPASAKLFYGLPAGTRKAGGIDLNGFTVTVDGLHQNTSSTDVLGINNTNGSGHLIINQPGGGNDSFNGFIGIPTITTGFIFGIPNDDITLTLASTNTGTLKIGGVDKTYTGATTINGGALLANAIFNSTAFVVNNGGTLGGTGTIVNSATINAGGTLAPGEGLGTLTVGSLSLDQANLSFDLDAPGTNDLVNIGGLLTATGTNTFTFTNSGGLATGTYTLLDYSSFTGSLANFGLASSVLGAFQLSLANDTTNGAIVLNVTPDTNQWIGATGANWTAPGSWSSGNVPNSASAEARFLGMGGSPANLDASQTVNKLTFNTNSSYTLSGPVANVLSLAGTNPTINVTGNGTQTLATSLNLGAGTVLNVNSGQLTLALPAGATSSIGTNVTANVAAGASLNLSGALSALGSTSGNKAAILTNAATSQLQVASGAHVVGHISGPGPGAGTAIGQITVASQASLTANGLRQNKLTLAAGTASAFTRVNAATVDGGANGLVVLNNTVENGGTGSLGLSLANESYLDLNDNDLVVYYNSEENPLSTITQYLDNYYSFGSAPGNNLPMIGSTVVDNSGGSRVIVAVDNANSQFGDMGNPFYDLTLGNSTLGTGFNQVIIRFTYPGDYNLDGQVDGADYTVVDSNLGAVTPGLSGGWTLGDGDFDGLITPADYLPIDSNFGSGVGNPLGGNPAISAIPEPSVWVLGGLAAVAWGAFGWRRRS
ncbi:MAG: autotransporter-associated beta strand repeat-containing protein [Pirellulales bacterium]|nr:autotransporter-associated beta strand repeat-containing protein [Pirellulales bacterium]